MTIPCDFYVNDEIHHSAPRRAHRASDNSHRPTQESRFRAVVRSGGFDLLAGPATHDPLLHRGAHWTALGSERARLQKPGWPGRPWWGQAPTLAKLSIHPGQRCSPPCESQQWQAVSWLPLGWRAPSSCHTVWHVGWNRNGSPPRGSSISYSTRSD